MDVLTKPIYLYIFQANLMCCKGTCKAFYRKGNYVSMVGNQLMEKCVILTCPVRCGLPPGAVSLCRQHMMVDMHSVPWVIPAGLHAIVLRPTKIYSIMVLQSTKNA